MKNNSESTNNNQYKRENYKYNKEIKRRNKAKEDKIKEENDLKTRRENNDFLLFGFNINNLKSVYDYNDNDNNNSNNNSSNNSNSNSNIKNANNEINENVYLTFDSNCKDIFKEDRIIIISINKNFILSKKFKKLITKVKREIIKNEKSKEKIKDINENICVSTVEYLNNSNFLKELFHNGFKFLTIFPYFQVKSELLKSNNYDGINYNNCNDYDYSKHIEEYIDFVISKNILCRYLDGETNYYKFNNHLVDAIIDPEKYFINQVKNIIIGYDDNNKSNSGRYGGDSNKKIKINDDKIYNVSKILLDKNINNYDFCRAYYFGNKFAKYLVSREIDNKHLNISKEDISITDKTNSTYFNREDIMNNPDIINNNEILSKIYYYDRNINAFYFSLKIDEFK